MTLLRKHIWWLALATMAGIAGALLIHVSLPARYVSTAEVDVEPNTAALTITYTPNMVTEQQVATSGVVLDNAASALGTTPTALEKNLSATVSGTDATGGTANVLSINCAMPTAISAQRCAAAAADAYMAFRNDANQPKNTRAHDPMLVTLVTPATLPTASSGVGLRILLPVGALLGLLLGTGAVFVRDHMDHRVRDRADLERLLDAPVLAEIPVVRHSHDVFIRRPLSAAAESYRFIREHLNPLITSVPDGGAVLLVAEAQSRDGCTSVAANLAIALAETGANVLLVDADLWHPSLGAVFDAGRRPGWSDLLAGRASLDEVAVPVPRVPGLRLVSAGYVTARPADIFRETRLDQAFGAMRAQADVIVVDSAPVLEVSHTIALARSSDLVAVVADARRTTREDVSAVAQQIRAAGPRVIFGIVNGVASPVNGRARPAPAHGGALTPVAEVPAILASAVPPRGPNGKHGELFGAPHVYPRKQGDTGTDTDDGPGQGEVRQ
ncbi:MAG: P-loop NTPase [Actinobacteria bacterium]|nr:P-loop NTPase [Actinomycetota bacterium]